MKIPNILKSISSHLQKQNAKLIIVGGSVRDHFLKLPCKDVDIEVYGLASLEALEKILSTFGTVNLVGKSFGVLKFTHDGEEYDFSFPREEVKIAKGHRGFDVHVDGTLSYEKASKRRDFSVNALGYDIESEEFLDPFGGLEGLKAQRLRHIDDKTFIEDPLRVYRAVQFCARFDFDLAPETFSLCKKMVEDGSLTELPKERIYEEWKKLLLKSPKPSRGFELMRELGILERYFPELHALIGVPQSPKWHPEGDVWIHTMMTLDEMAKLCVQGFSAADNEKQKLKYMFAILCHDLGKATHTSVDEEGNVRSIGHDIAGLEPTKSLMARLTSEHDFIESLLPLVEHHLKPSQFYRAKSKDAAIRRLATKVNIEELLIVAKADFLGRTTEEALAGVYHAGKWMKDKAKSLKVSTKPLENVLQGRDLIALGLKPSVKFTEILDAVYTKLLEGKILTKSDAITFVKNYLNEEKS